MTTRTPPKAHSLSTGVGFLATLMLLAVGVVGIHDWLTGLGWVGGEEWVASAIDAVDDAQLATWMVIAAVPVALAGLCLVLIGLKPRRRTHQPTPDAAIDLWATTGALAAIARNTADRQSGVASATACVGRRRVDVDVRTTERAAGVQSRVQEAVEESLQGLTTHPVRVRVKEVTR